jgi:thioredoxin 1
MAKQVIKFYADWCGPCKVYGPTFERVKQDLQDIVEFKEVNIEDDPENLSGEYKVRGIPHTIIVEDGKVIKSQSGRIPEQQLRTFILT